MPSLEELAQAAGLSRFHFHRAFKEATGLTPKAYATAQRAARPREALPHSTTVTEAIYDAAYNSSSQIGSESCRERVGQTVWICVVAVSSKNKNISWTLP